MATIANCSFLFQPAPAGPLLVMTNRKKQQVPSASSGQGLRPGRATAPYEAQRRHFAGPPGRVLAQDDRWKHLRESSPEQKRGWTGTGCLGHPAGYLDSAPSEMAVESPVLNA